MPDKKVRIGIIGSGGIAQNAHMPGYATVPELCEIVAVADSNEAVAREAAEKFNVKNVFTDYTKLLELDEIDAVSVCTPNYLHMDPTIRAFEAGKHVLCEKPIAMNAGEAKRMVEAGNKARKKFQVGYNNRFLPSNQLIKRHIDAGDLGQIYYARAQAMRRRGIPGWG